MRKKVKVVKNDTNPPKHFLGALIGAGVSIGSSLIQGGAERKARARAEAENRQNLLEQETQADVYAYDEFKEQGLDSGVGTVNYYQAKGGKLANPDSYMTRGGDLKPVSSDMEEVVGNKHNESKIDGTSGVKLNNGKQDIAEVEDAEMIKDGRMVYSAQTTVDGKNTYADVAKKLSTEKGKLEDDIQNDDKITMGTKRRKIAAISRKENELFADQEANKQPDPKKKSTTNPLADTKRAEADKIDEQRTGRGHAFLTEDLKKKFSANLRTEADRLDARDKKTQERVNGIPKGGKGLTLPPLKGIDTSMFDVLTPNKQLPSYKLPLAGTSGTSKANFGKAVENVVPYLDNVANAFITGNTPSIPKPTLVKQRNLETKVNVNPQLANIASAKSSAVKSIQDNTSNSNVARANIAATKLAGAKQVGEVLTAKDNQERANRNANVRQRTNVDTINAGKVDQHNLANVQRADAISQRQSANFANLAGDIVDKRNFDAEQAYNADRLDVAREIGDVEGTSLRVDLKNPTTLNKLRTDKVYAAAQLEKYKNSPRDLAAIKAAMGI